MSNPATPVSIIIACYNEEKYIGKKLEELFNPVNWIHDSEIIVVSNGCTDNSNKIIEGFTGRKELRFFRFEERIGKIASVNFAVNKSVNEILIFSDCRQSMNHGAIKNLIKNFDNSDVGTVSSTLLDENRTISKVSPRKFINWINLSESKTGTCMNVYGALYAQRKSVFREIPQHLLFDDLFVTISTLLQGKKVLQENKARIFDVHFYEYYSSERIERLVRGLLIFLSKEWSMVKRLKLNYFILFMAHKYLKLLLPYLILILFILSLVKIGTALAVPFLSFLILFYVLFREKKNFLILFLRVNLHMILSTLKFIILRERSNDWRKLDSRYN